MKRKPESLHKIRFLNYILSIAIGIVVCVLKRREAKHGVILGVISSVVSYMGNSRVLK